MSLTWSDLLLLPDEQVVTETAAAWKWLVPEPWKIVACSMFGGVFFEKSQGGVFWLECPTAQVEQVASSAAEFHAFLGGERDEAWEEQTDEWFLPGLVQQLHDAKKRPGPGQCYGLTILPIFDGGRYSVGNVFVLPVREWLTVTASLHQQVRELPDGSRVEIKVVD